ncbi:MAG: AAA family ATPase [Burkholderiaceae bacterium]
MYAQHFGLEQAPFSIAPDPRYLFMSERHREALAHLLYGLRGGGGFVVLTGEIGAGKTTVCRCFLEQVPKRCNVAYIFNPKLTVEELLQTVCAEFHVQPRHDGPGPATVKTYVDALNEFLLRTHAVGQNNVLIIDEAQNLSADVLEQLRLLTNLETHERKLLQIVLIGQPELRAMLARPELEQLAQRVIARYHLDALSAAESAQYVQHRLTVAGSARPSPFDARALARLHRYSRGVPRRINLLCDRALLGAYAKGESRVGARTIDAAAREVLGTPDFATVRRARARSALQIGGGVAAGLLLAGALALSTRHDAAVPPADATPEPPAAANPEPARAPADASTPASKGPADGAAAAMPAPSAGSSPAASASSRPAPDSAAPSTTPAPPADSASSAPSAPPAAPFDVATGFDALAASERQAWRALARVWNVDVGADDPCEAAARQRIRCFRTANGTLSLIGQLDRPGILTLRDGHHRAAYALLIGLDERNATLRIDGVPRAVPRVALANYWRGEFATLWRAPPDYAGPIADSRAGASAQWLARQLAAARGDGRAPAAQFGEAELKAWVHAFQLTQGLPSDGIAGPVTLMQLNRAAGVDEPRMREK